MYGRLLLHPEGLYLLLRTTLRHRFAVGGFRLPCAHHCTQADFPGGYPHRFRLSISPRLEALVCFIASSWPQAWFRYGIFKVQCRIFLPYLNHAYDPAFAVHRCTSPMLSQQGDRSEPAPVGNRLPAPAFAKPCTGLITCAFTDHSEIQNRISHSAIRLLDQLLPLYPNFSGSRHVTLGGIPVSYRRPSQYPAGFFPYTG